jgi:hypothetical protein
MVTRALWHFKLRSTGLSIDRIHISPVYVHDNTLICGVVFNWQLYIIGASDREILISVCVALAWSLQSFVAQSLVAHRLFHVNLYQSTDFDHLTALTSG